MVKDHMTEHHTFKKEIQQDWFLQEDRIKQGLVHITMETQQNIAGHLLWFFFMVTLIYVLAYLPPAV